MNMACKPLFVDFQLILRDFKIIYKEIDVLNVKIFTGRYSGLISVWKLKYEGKTVNIVAVPILPFFMVKFKFEF